MCVLCVLRCVLVCAAACVGARRAALAPPRRARAWRMCPLCARNRRITPLSVVIWSKRPSTAARSTSPSSSWRASASSDGGGGAEPPRLPACSYSCWRSLSAAALYLRAPRRGQLGWGWLVRRTRACVERRRQRQEGEGCCAGGRAAGGQARACCGSPPPPRRPRRRAPAARGRAPPRCRGLGRCSRRRRRHRRRR